MISQRIFLKAVGTFFVGLAVLGAALPLLPTTPFLLVAAACYAKSSPRLHKKLLDNKVFGPLIRHWQESRSIPKKAKFISLVTIVVFSSWSIYMLENIYLRILVVALVIGPIIFISRLPLAKEESDT